MSDPRDPRFPVDDAALLAAETPEQGRWRTSRGSRSCGPTHHEACACREAKVRRLVEAARALTDTLNAHEANPYGRDGESILAALERQKRLVDAGEACREALAEWKED